MEHAHDKPASFHRSPQEALQAPPEEFLYLGCLHEGTGVDAPDFVAVVDAERGEIVHETPMPNVGDELHHYGWNRCSSACHGPERSHLIVPGFRSSRIHVVNVADDPRRPRVEKVIEPEDVVRETGYTRPHTVHCMPGDNVVVSMLGDAEGNGAGGFAVLDAKTFELKGRWENGGAKPPLNYDFWYQPRKNVLVSSEFGEPNAYEPGFELDDVGAGRYGRRLHFWNRENSEWRVEQVIAVDGVEHEGWPFPVPGLITDLVLSMDDRFLYFSNWLHGDLRQYEVSDPSDPKLTGQLWLGGLLGKGGAVQGHKLQGGPQMLQLSLDGKRLYVTNSLLSSWDNQFYPDLAKAGSSILQVECDTVNGGLSLNEQFYVDFGKEPAGPARAHEMRYPGGDCTSEIWV